MLGCLGPTAALVAGMQGSCEAASIVVGVLISDDHLSIKKIVLCRDDEDEVPGSQR